jgi:chemotaxis protein methyltransferase CheR
MKATEKEILRRLRENLDVDIQDLNPDYVEEVFSNFLSNKLYETNAKTDDEYLQEIKRLLFNNYSAFFRNPVTMAVLELYVLPSLLERRFNEGAQELRLWSAACSEGQETYSLAMLLEEQLLIKNNSMKYRIISTDLLEDNLKQAKSGVYSTEALEKISLGRFHQFFEGFGNKYKVIDQIQNNITFQFFDLLSSKQYSPSAGIFGSYDLIFCSNVLIYYKPDVQQAILKRLENSIAPRGVLVVGEAERGLVQSNIFLEVIPLSGVFQKRMLPYFS